MKFLATKKNWNAHGEKLKQVTVLVLAHCLLDFFFAKLN